MDLNQLQKFKRKQPILKRSLINCIYITDKGVEELLIVHSAELSNEDFIVMKDNLAFEVEEEPEDVPGNEIPTHSFTVKGLSEAFFYLDKVIDIFEGQDPNFERSEKSTLKNAVACYRAIHKEKKRATSKQTTLDLIYRCI